MSRRMPVLILALSVCVASALARGSTRQSRAARRGGLGISRATMRARLDRSGLARYRYHESAPVHGDPCLVGRSDTPLSSVRFVGPPDNLRMVSLTAYPNVDGDMIGLVAHVFVGAVIPRADPVLKWVIHHSLASARKPQVLNVPGREVRLTAAPTGSRVVLQISSAR